MIYTLILIISLLLRLPLLNQSLWLDESIQALALMGKMGPILEYAKADFQPPLYHFLLYGWTRIFGFSEISLRTPSLLAGVITVYFIMKIAQKLAGNKLAIAAGLLAATNPLLTYYSQEGRTYMLTTLLVTASFFYLIDIDKKSNKLKYFLFASLSLYSSYLAWIAIAVQFFILIFKNKKYALLPILSFLTLLPWIPSLFQQIQIGLSTASNFKEWGRVVGGFETSRIPRTWIKFVLGRVSFENRYLYLAIVVGVFVYHLKFLLKSKYSKNKFLITWLLLIPTVALFISMFIPVYQYFRVLFVLPSYLLLLAGGIVNSKNSKKSLLKIVFLQLIFLLIFWVNPKFHRENWRSLVNYINLSGGKSAAVALPSISQNAPLKYYKTNYEIIQPNKQVDYSYNTIYYINYVEDLFDPDQLGRKNILLAGYDIESEVIFTSLHLIIYKR